MDKNQPYANLVSHIFIQLFDHIEHPRTIVPNPGTVLPEKKQRIMTNWLKEVIEWAEDDNNFWLEAYETFLEYDRRTIKKIIIEKAKNKLKQLQ